MKKMNWAASVIVLLAASGCSKSSTPTGTVNMSLKNLSITTGTSNDVEAFRDLFSLSNPVERNGNYSTASQLVSLKYAFQQIELCQSVDATSAFGFSSESGCASLYSNSSVVNLSSSDDISTFLAAYNSTNTFDLMSTSDIARLNQNSTAAAAGTYNYVLVNWADAIGVEGSVTVGGTTLYTQGQTSISSSGGEPISTVPSMTAASSPAMTWVKSANGGTVFKFQTPQTVAAGSTYVLDVIFNPNAVLNGCLGGATGNITDGTNGITMPMLPVTAALISSGDTLMRESYPISTADTFANYQVDLYYAKSDTTKSVIAAQITGLVTPTSGCYAPDNRVFIVNTATDGSLTFLSTTTASTGTLLSGLVRGSSGAGSTLTFGPYFTGLPSGITTGTEGAVTVTAY